MDIKLPSEIINIFEKFQANKFEIYLVGGAVRDLYLGRDVKDWDFATNATPSQIQTVCPDSYYNNSFGTVGIPAVDPSFEPHEITTFRSEESYSDFRRPDKVTWGDNIFEDLARRDFTINSIALTQSAGKTSIIDPYSGLDDLKKRIIKAVLDPYERFQEDALRLMRAVRIASELGFSIEKDTLEALAINAPLIQKIAKERIKDELFKLLSSKDPYHGITLLIQTRLADEILPEFTKTFGVEQKSPQRHHKYDVGTHSLMSLKNCKSTDPLVRLAVLLHDVGKAQTYKKMQNGVITFYNHEVVGSRIVANIAKRLKFSSSESERIFKLVRYHQFTVDERQTDSAIRRFIKNVGNENISDMLTLRTADRLGGGATETSWRLEEYKKRIIEVQKQPFSVRDLKVNGTDVMNILNIPPGKKVGETLEKLFKLVENKKLNNEKEDLIAEIEKLK